MKSKLLKKMTALLLALLMVLNLSALNLFAEDTLPKTIAAWDYTAAPSGPAVSATSGDLAASAVLTNFSKAVPTFSTSSLCIAGWDGGANTKYWQLGLSTKGYENLKLSAKTRSSGTGPRDFKVVYSTDDGVNWIDVTDSTYKITGTGLSNYMPTVSLPSGAANREKLLIRFIMTSNISSRAGTGAYPADELAAPGGTSNINNILIIGNPLPGAPKAAAVTADPPSGAVDAGTQISLSTTTEGALIKYSLNGAAEYLDYFEPIKINEATTIKAYAAKPDYENSDVAMFIYTIKAHDTESPIITHTPISKANISQDLGISAAVSDNIEVKSVKLYYRAIGAAEYKTAIMLLNNGEYSYAIPKSELTASGIEYYLEASDGTNIALAPTDITKPYTVTITEEDLVPPEITGLTPANGAATGAVLRPTISASYSDASGIEISSVRLYLDNIDVTAKSTIAEDKAVYVPSDDLAAGEHTVKITVKDRSAAANLAEASWRFFVGEERYNFYFGQLHSHTGEISDGQGTLVQAYTGAKAAGADFFAVTDHSNWFDDEKNKANENITNISDSTSSEWKKMHAVADSFNKDGEFVAIAGYEMTWSGSTGGWGHINTFNTPWFVSRSNTAMDLKSYYQKLAQNPASISQLNHPSEDFGNFADFGYYSPEADKVVNLVEVGNGEGAVRSSGYFPSYEYYTRALDKGWHVAPSNNQDNHKGNWISANDARTVILAKTLTRESIFDAIRNMHVYATEDKNLEIMYKLNDSIMGTILDKPSRLSFKITVNDPDSTDRISKISIISNGGIVAATKSFDSNAAAWEFELDPKYSYYYVRVEQADKDIAVTAPIWVGEADKAGISGTTSSSSLHIKGQKLTVTTKLFNNESTPMKIKSLEYSINGSIINTAPALSDIAALGTGQYSFDYVPSVLGEYNIDVKLVAVVNGVDKIFADVLKLNVSDPAMLTTVVIDASHYNDYVSGYYPGNMTNFIKLAGEKQINIVMQTEKLTDAALKDAKLLVLSAPAKKKPSGSNPAYDAKPYTEDEIAVIKNFADNGGSIIITGLADYQDNRNDATNHTAYQQNLILQAIGAGSRINDDEVVDYESNPNANTTKAGGSYGTPYRIPMNAYNFESKYLNGVLPEQAYSFYSGCSITMGSNATWLVKGTTTTYGFDSDNDKLGGSYVASAGAEMPADTGIGKGNVVALATEKLPGGGQLFIAGTVFYSNFEIKADLDNSTQLQNSNYNITMNILNAIKQDVAVSKIDQVRAGTMGKTYRIQGRVTAESEVYSKTHGTNNAFFEVIYVQDETGGITVFGVSQKEIPLGAEVIITGWLDEYYGDMELQIRNENADVIMLNTPVQLVEPKKLTTAESMLEANEGLLLKIQGKVSKLTDNTLYINDGSGEARVYVNGYIGNGTSDTTMLGKWDPAIQVGDTVYAIGLASQDADGQRLRVRNTSEIVRLKDTVPPVISIEGVTEGGIYNTDVAPVITVDKGAITMTLNGAAYTGEIIKQEGRYILEITAIDRDNNMTSKLVAFTLDKTAPVIKSSIKNNSVYDKLEVIQIKNTAEDALSGILIVETTLDGSKIDNNCSLNLESMNLGIHRMVITAKDKAGNSNVEELYFTVAATNKTLENLLVELNKQGHFKNNGIYNSLISMLDPNNLKPFENHLNAQKGKGISIEAANIIQQYINWIKAK